MELRIPEGARFRCLSCGRCCRTKSISLTAGEAERLQGFATPEMGSVVSAIPTATGTRYHIRPRRDGSCPFLGEDGLCAIHKEHGPDEKPLACRLYPFHFVRSPAGILVSLRFSCPAVAAGTGPPAAEAEDALRGLAREVGEMTGIKAVGDRAHFDEDRRMSFADLSVLQKHLLAILDAPADSLASRIRALGEFMDLVASSSLEAPTRRRYWEGIRKGLGKRILARPLHPVSPPGLMERRLFRQVAFGLSALSSPAALRMSLPGRLVFRLAQALRGTLYIFGRRSLGRAPGAESLDGAIARIGAGREEEARPPGEPLVRFLRMQAASYAFFADRYTPTTVLGGAQALLLGAPFALWFARAAAAQGPLTFEHAVEGLVRLADAYATPVASSLLGLGLSGRLLHRRGTLERLLAWAAGTEPGEPVRFADA